MSIILSMNDTKLKKRVYSHFLIAIKFKKSTSIKPCK